jgi:hypothetical protein
MTYLDVEIQVFETRIYLQTMPTFRALPNVAQHYEMLANALEYCLVPLDMSNSVNFLQAFHIFIKTSFIRGRISLLYRINTSHLNKKFLIARPRETRYKDLEFFALSTWEKRLAV